MKRLKMERKKLLLTGVIILLLIGVVVASVIIHQRRKEGERQDEVTKVDIASDQNVVINDYNFPAADVIIDDSENNEEAAIKLVSFAYMKMNVEKYSDAYLFFEGASKLDGVTQETKEAALTGMYTAADKLGDEDKKSAARDELGEEAYYKYFEQSYAEDQRGE